MVVQHNLRAMNSNRMLGITTKSQSKSTEKLSSGYKINRAADDAAGLSISEKMRKQIRGLTQASLNAQDGISAVQTAEGALTEVHDMLQRMNELAVKAANGTNSSDDRQYIQSEVDQLISEIDRVAETTKFNETYLLKGDPNSTTTVTKTTDATVNSITIADGAKYASSYSVTGNNTYYVVDNKGAQVATLSSKSTDKASDYIDSEGKAKAGYAIYTTWVSGTPSYGAATSLEDVDSNDLKTSWSGLAKKDTNNKYVEVAESELIAGGMYFDANGNYKGGLYSVSSDGATGIEIGAERITDFVTRDAEPGTTTTETIAAALSFNLHVGAESATNNKITLSINSMSATGIGVKGLKVNNETSATAAIDTIKSAIQKVSEQRSTLGAIQNRLEHTINNLDNVVENTTSAEAQIRDTDMATEMVKYSNNNILAQAGQAMLAQSNQANQGVLSLLG